MALPQRPALRELRGQVTAQRLILGIGGAPTAFALVIERLPPSVQVTMVEKKVNSAAISMARGTLRGALRMRSLSTLTSSIPRQP